MGSKHKKQKLSPDKVEDSDEEVTASAEDLTSNHISEDPQKNDDNEVFFSLAPRRRLTIRKWKGSTLIDIREFWGEGDNLKPSKKGISLSIAQWRQLLRMAPEVEKLVSDSE